MESIILESQDTKFVAPLEPMIALSGSIKNVIEQRGYRECEEIPLNLDPKILEKVIIFCKRAHENPQEFYEEPQDPENRRFGGREITEWEREFYNYKGKETPIEIMDVVANLARASIYMLIDPLLNSTSNVIAKFIEGMKTEQLRELFGVVNDFEPGEEERIRAENEWI